MNTVLSPAHPVGFAMMLLRRRVDHARQTPERGASAIEWVIITAVVVAMVVVVAAVIWNKVNTSSNEISNSTDPTQGGGGGAP